VEGKLNMTPLGLQFECQRGCTKCCETEGYVYITEKDLKRIARYLKMTAAEFEAKYVFRTRHLLRLRKPGGGKQCHFLEAGGCSIHPVNPVQCRVYPFWPELVENRAEWKREAKRCPGIAKGTVLIQIGDALERSSEMKAAYPGIYD
jgi:Fe-S-cluster containining protein